MIILELVLKFIGDIIIKQYLLVYTGAFLMSIYDNVTKQQTDFKEIVRIDEDKINPLRLQAYYWGFIFWMIVIVFAVYAG